MRSRTLLFLFFIQSAVSFAQDSLFTKVYYQQGMALKAACIERSYTDGLVIAGTYLDQEGMTMAVDSLGNMLWSKKYNFGSTSWEGAVFNQVISLSDSAYIVAGKMKDDQASRFKGICMKIDRQGNVLWSRSLFETINADYEITAVAEAADSSYVVTGTISEGHDIFVARLGHAGNLLWSKSFSVLVPELYTSSIGQTPDGGFAVNGYSFSTGGMGFEGVVMKLSPLGDIEFAWEYQNFIGSDLEIANDGVFIFGQDEHGSMMELIKTDFTGVGIWQRNYPGYDTHLIGAVEFEMLSDSSFVFNDKNEYYSYVTKLDKTGRITQAKMMTMIGAETVETKNKGLFIVGTGPIFGIKSLIDPHIGLIRADSLLESDDCLNINSDTTTQITMPVIGTSIISNFTITHNNLSAQNAPVAVEAITPSSQRGCVDVFGGVGENSLAEQLKVYPNSSTGIFNFEQETLNNVQISIFNSAGTEIFSTKTSALSTVVDLSTKANGVYFYKVTDPSNRSAEGKLVLLK